MVHRLLLASLFALPLAACASATNTPAQDVAWERWKRCDHFASVQLARIEANGTLWVTYRVAAERTLWHECMKQAAEEQARQGRFKAGEDPIRDADVATSLLRYAYMTNQPPDPKTYLHGSWAGPLSNMPPETRTFSSNDRATFFFALAQAGRVIQTESNGSRPMARLLTVRKRS